MTKILVIQTAFLGDAVLTLPLIQELKRNNPDAQLSVLCIPSTTEIFESSAYVSETLSYDKHKTQRSIWSYIKLLFSIHKQEFVEVYSPHRSARSTLISFFSGAKKRVGFDKAALSFLYTTRVKYVLENHEVKRNLSLLSENLPKDWRVTPEIKITDKSIEKIDRLLKDIKKRIIAVAPGSVWQTKIYPKEHFIEVIKHLTATGYFIIMIGGKEDKSLCEAIKNKINENIISLAGILSISESIELLKRCILLISNDSAPTHLGMIADIPVLTIYCSTVPAFGFYPYNSKSKIVSLDGLSCKPCGIHGHNECPIKTFDCGYKLLPREVLSKFSEMQSV